jgi:DNA-binding CsgD family transcriptional regulator
VLSALSAGDTMSPGARSVLLVDASEHIHGDLARLLAQLAPALSEDALLVFASRCRAPEPVALDTAWSRLTLERTLMPLSDGDATKLLERRGVGPTAHRGILDFANGFPLALVIAADLVTRSASSIFTLELLEEARHTLSRLLCPLDTSPARQLALEVSSLVRTTTPELVDSLCASLNDETRGEEPNPFDWLTRQSFIDWTPEGLRPHPLLRIALESRLRRERPRRHRSMMRALRELSVSALEVGANPGADLVNLFFLDRNLPHARRWPPVLDEEPGQPLEPAHSRDHAQIITLVGRAEGSEAAALATAYLQLKNCHVEVTRGHELAALVQYVRFDRDWEPDQLPDEDPASALLARFVAQNPLEGEEESLFVRWFLDARDYQTPSTRVLAITARLVQLVLAHRQLAYSFCVFRAPDEWAALWQSTALPWHVAGTFRVGEHDYSLVVFTWKRRSLRDVMLQAWEAPQVDETAPSTTLNYDELKLKVSERVAELARKIKLTPRELEILEQLCLGGSIEDIARSLSIRPRTVKFHKENLLRKSGASSRAELFRKLL